MLHNGPRHCSLGPVSHANGLDFVSDYGMSMIRHPASQAFRMKPRWRSVTSTLSPNALIPRGNTRCMTSCLKPIKLLMITWETRQLKVPETTCMYIMYTYMYLYAYMYAVYVHVSNTSVIWVILFWLQNNLVKTTAVAILWIGPKGKFPLKSGKST